MTDERRNDVQRDIGRDEMKAAFKEAAKEFLREQWTQTTSTFGKWVMGVIAAATLAALLWLVLTANGWKAP